MRNGTGDTVSNESSAYDWADNALAEKASAHRKGRIKLGLWKRCKAHLAGWLAGRRDAARVELAVEAVAYSYSTALMRVADLEAELSRKTNEALGLKAELEACESSLKISQLEVTLLAEANNRNIERIRAERAVVAELTNGAKVQ
jgi:hypothetical protein